MELGTGSDSAFCKCLPAQDPQPRPGARDGTGEQDVETRPRELLSSLRPPAALEAFLGEARKEEEGRGSEARFKVRQ